MLFCVVRFEFYISILILDFVCFCRGIFSSPSQKETTVDIGEMKDVAQEPATPAEALETILGGLTLRHKRGAWSTAKLKV